MSYFVFVFILLGSLGLTALLALFKLIGGRKVPWLAVFLPFVAGWIAVTCQWVWFVLAWHS